MDHSLHGECAEIFHCSPDLYLVLHDQWGQVQGDDSIQARTKDGQLIFIDASVIYAVDPTKVIQLHITWQNRYEENVVRPVTRATTRDVLSQYNAAEINGDKRVVIQQYIADEIKQNLTDNYLILIDFTIQKVRFAE